MDDLKPKQEIHKSGWETPESMRAGFEEAALRMTVPGDCDSPYKRRCLAAKKQSENILARAQAENRPMTPLEEQQARACKRAAVCALLDDALFYAVEGIEQEAKGDRLNRTQVKHLKKIARMGLPEARKLLRKNSGNSARTPGGEGDK